MQSYRWIQLALGGFAALSIAATPAFAQRAPADPADSSADGASDGAPGAGLSITGLTCERTRGRRGVRAATVSFETVLPETGREVVVRATLGTWRSSEYFTVDYYGADGRELATLYLDARWSDDPFDAMADDLTPEEATSLVMVLGDRSFIGGMQACAQRKKLPPWLKKYLIKGLCTLAAKLCCEYAPDLCDACETAEYFCLVWTKPGGKGKPPKPQP